MVDSRRLDRLDPAEVARLGGIEIVAQGVVEGFLAGIHRSPFRGFSVEFTEHRAYQPGDELRYLDRKILARPDRPSLPAAPWPPGDRAPRDGPGRAGIGGAARGALPRPRERGERRRAPPRARRGLRRDGAPGDRGVARRLPAARGRLSSHPDRHAVRHGAAPAGVTFLHPLALLGLAAAAIPALLHLLERRPPPEPEFPPLRYLRDAERQSARRLRLRHLLLLILRTALVAVIVLAAARPIMPTGGSGGNGTGSGAVQ